METQEFIYLQKKQRPLDYRLRDNLRRRLAKTLKGIPKEKSAHELLGCSWRHFKRHLEKQFTGDMSWDNYGEWHLDHIYPCMNFDFTKRGQQKKCFHYKNIRPLMGETNRQRRRRFAVGEEII